jgi:hypothetical protein
VGVEGGGVSPGTAPDYRDVVQSSSEW